MNKFKIMRRIFTYINLKKLKALFFKRIISRNYLEQQLAMST